MSAKTIFRTVASRVLLGTGLTRPSRAGRGRLSIATFHRVLPEPNRLVYPYPDLAVTPEELDSYLGYFCDHYDCGTLATQHSRFLNGDFSGKPLLAITFDDGQYDNFRYAAPILGRHGIKASFFIPVVAVENRELLWHDRLGFAVRNLLCGGESKVASLRALLLDFGIRDQKMQLTVQSLANNAKCLSLAARLDFVDQVVSMSADETEPPFARLMEFGEIEALASEGHEIGSHSMTHCLLPECNDRQLAYEFNESRQHLQAKLGLSVESFCYPNGNCDERTASAAARSGYKRAVVTAWGSNQLGADSYRLHRFDMVARHTLNCWGQISPAIVAFRMSEFYKFPRQ